jgi:hypothetical protein
MDETLGTALPPDLSPPEWTGLRRGRDGRLVRTRAAARTAAIRLRPHAARTPPAARTCHVVRPSPHAAGRPRLPRRLHPHVVRARTPPAASYAPGLRQGQEWCRSSPSGQAEEDQRG